MPEEPSDTRLRTDLANRADVLRTLHDGPSTKPELVDELAAARSTIDRAIRDLTDVGCVEAVDGRYRPTASGRVALDAYESYVDRTRAIHNATAFLDGLPADASMPTELLQGSEITIAEGHATDTALGPSIELLERATTLRGLAPVVHSLYPQIIEDRIVDNGLTVEVIAQENVIRSLPELAGGDASHLVEHEAVQLHTTTEPLPYSLWLMDLPEGTVAGITAHEDGRVHGVLINDTEAAIEAAEDQYECYRQSSTLEPAR